MIGSKGAMIVLKIRLTIKNGGALWPRRKCECGLIRSKVRVSLLRGCFSTELYDVSFPTINQTSIVNSQASQHLLLHAHDPQTQKPKGIIICCMKQFKFFEPSRWNPIHSHAYFSFCSLALHSRCKFQGQDQTDHFTWLVTSFGNSNLKLDLLRR